MKLAVCYLLLGLACAILTFIGTYEDVSCFGCPSQYVFNPISIVFGGSGLIFLILSFKRVYMGANLSKVNKYQAKDLTNNSEDINI